MRYLKFLAMTALLVSSNVFAGGDSSSGGGAMVCRDAEGRIKSAYLLDLWEMQFAEKPTEILRSDEDVETQVEKAVERIRGSLGTRAVEEFREYLKTVRSKAREVQPGIELSPPTDALNDLNQVGCKLEGVALFNDRKELLYINPEILKAMPNTDQAALWVHEVIYKARREAMKDQNSIATREFVGWLFGSNYSRTDLQADSYILCRSDLNNWGGHLAVIFLKPRHDDDYLYFNVSPIRPALGFTAHPMMNTVHYSSSKLLNLVDRKITPAELSYAQSLIEHNGKGKSGLKTFEFWESISPWESGRSYASLNFVIAAAGMTAEEGLIMTTWPDQDVYRNAEKEFDPSKTLFTYEMTERLFRSDTLKSLTRNKEVQPRCKRYALSSDSPLPY